MHIPPIFYESLTRRARREIKETRYQLGKRGEMKQPANLDKLSNLVADFGGHLRGIFIGTHYGISRAVDCTTRPIPDTRNQWVHAFFEIYQLRHEGSGLIKALPAGEVRIRGIGAPVSKPIVEVDTYANMADLGRAITSNFDFSELAMACYIP